MASTYHARRLVESICNAVRAFATASLESLPAAIPERNCIARFCKEAKRA